MADSDKSKRKTPKVIDLQSGCRSPQQNFSDSIAGMQGLKLVGTIKEKGFSEESQSFKSKGISLPEPRVTPFPVARHRSEGPHWTSLSHTPEEIPDETGDAEDIGAEQMAALAKRLEKKKKKHSNFHNWREKLSAEAINAMRPMKTEKEHAADNTLMDRIQNLEIFSETAVSKTCSGKMSAVTSDRKLSSFDQDGGGLSIKENNKDIGQSILENANKDVIGSSSVLLTERKYQAVSSEKNIAMQNAGNENAVQQTENAVQQTENAERVYHSSKFPQNYVPENAGNDDIEQNFQREYNVSFQQSFEQKMMMDEIYEENQAKLHSMSFEEINEARQELLGRLKPEIVEMLKKRGIEKLGKRKDASVDSDKNKLGTRESVSEKIVSDDNKYSSQRDSKTINKLSKAATYKQNTTKDLFSCNSSNEWQAWSSKVEAVRHLRFLLDGSIVEPVEISENPPGSGGSLTAENVAERDILRTDGDPASLGYTIKEAVTLARSMVPGQRAVALQLIGTLLEKSQSGMLKNLSAIVTPVDWQATWTYLLGPEPKLVLTLRMALDDSHSTVVAACAKVLQRLLSYSENECYLELFETLWAGERSIFLAPVFKRKSKMDEGFLRGGIWKYSAKPSNMFPSSKISNDDDEDEGSTIADDEVVAGQDVAAGLIRMQILPRLRYILEVDQLEAAEDSCLSIIISLARHSPTSADTVMKCPRLINIIIQQFILSKTDIGVEPSQLKALRLMSILCQAERSNCVYFIESGAFQAAEKHLFCYKNPYDWLESGQENFKSICAALVEELRMWRICIYYGLCISYFSDFYSTLCFWLSSPSYEKLIANNVVKEVLDVARESFLVLRALAKTLPDLGHEVVEDQETEAWSWNQALPMVDVALEWFDFMHCSILFPENEENQNLVVEEDSKRLAFLRVTSAILNTLSSVCEKIIQNDGQSSPKWLSAFIRKVFLKIIKSGLLYFPELGANRTHTAHEHLSKINSFFEYLCILRGSDRNEETLMAASTCLQGIVELITSMDKITAIESKNNTFALLPEGPGVEEMSQSGLVVSSQNQLKSALTLFMNIVSSEWQYVQSSEMFGRGGPAPGIGVGWGSAGGGFWSTKLLVCHADARVMSGLLEIFPIIEHEDCSFSDKIEGKEQDAAMTTFIERINTTLSLMLMLGPKDILTLENAFKQLFTVAVIKFLYIHVCNVNKDMAKSDFSIEFADFSEHDHEIFSETLMLHFKNQWLTEKRKSSKHEEKGGKSCEANKDFPEKSPLETVPEHGELETLEHEKSLVIEWAKQKLPLPVQWLLSPLSIVDTTCSSLSTSNSCVFNDKPSSSIHIVQSGLILLLGLEAACCRNDTNISPVTVIPVVKKIHALSMVFIIGGDVFLERPVRNLIHTLQMFYGHVLENNVRNLQKCADSVDVNALHFQRDIHESYDTFIENFVEHFAATSFGDVTYGCQVAFYLRRDVETSIRLATWNALVGTQVLELLPKLEECSGSPRDYLFPTETHDKMIEAYAAAWVSGKLDKARSRLSITFSLALHHISFFVFMGDDTGKELLLRQKIARNLLINSQRKQSIQVMMVQLVSYNGNNFQEHHSDEDARACPDEIAGRCEFLSRSCEGDSMLSGEVQKIHAAAMMKTS